MTGFPTNFILIDPTPSGAATGEWAVSLPSYVAKGMKEQFLNSNILLGPGYSFGLYSCGDGLVKERGISNNNQTIDNGILKVWEWTGDKKVYLMKRD